MPSSHLILWHPLLLPSIFASTTVFSSEMAVHIRWLLPMTYSSVLLSQTQQLSPLSFGAPTEWDSLEGGIGKKLRVCTGQGLELSKMLYLSFMTLLDPKTWIRDSVVPSILLSLAPPHPCLPTHPIIISSVSLHGAACANFLSHMECPLPPSLIKNPACPSGPDYSLVFSTSYKAQLDKISHSHCPLCLFSLITLHMLQYYYLIYFMPVSPLD